MANKVITRESFECKEKAMVLFFKIAQEYEMDVMFGRTFVSGTAKDYHLHFVETNDFFYVRLTKVED